MNKLFRDTSLRVALMLTLLSSTVLLSAIESVGTKHCREHHHNHGNVIPIVQHQSEVLCYTYSDPSLLLVPKHTGVVQFASVSDSSLLINVLPLKDLDSGNPSWVTSFLINTTARYRVDLTVYTNSDDLDAFELIGGIATFQRGRLLYAANPYVYRTARIVEETGINPIFPASYRDLDDGRIIVTWIVDLNAGEQLTVVNKSNNEIGMTRVTDNVLNQIDIYLNP